MTSALNRRHLLALFAASAAMPLLAGCGAADAAPQNFPLKLSDAEWRKRLTPAQYAVLRQESTEYPFTSPLLKEHRKGTFTCAADGNPLFDSTTKFESGTGWPSFWKPLPGAIGTTTDYAVGYPRTEVHCARCGGHLGHVFNDGPQPNGLRYCMNGAALAFRPT